MVKSLTPVICVTWADFARPCLLRSGFICSVRLRWQGLFPFAGFWSKDEILLDAKLHFPTEYWLLAIAAFLTAFYMGRQIWMVFFGEARHEAAAHAEESPRVITVPLMVLAAVCFARRRIEPSV